MDRNTVIGFVLIGLVLMVWMYMNAPPPPKPGAQQDTTAAVAGKTGGKEAPTSRGLSDAARNGIQANQKASGDTLGKFFGPHAAGVNSKTIVIETDDYTAKISSRGGSILSWELKKFTTWAKFPVQLVNDTVGDFNLIFYSSDGKLINTKSLDFECNYANNQSISIPGHDSLKLQWTLPVNEKSRLIKTLTFRNGSYQFDCEYRFENMASVMSNYEYQLVWESGLRYAERNSVDESNAAQAYAYSGGELTEADAAKLNDSVKQNVSGNVSWVGTRTKYFGLAILPRNTESHQEKH